MKSVKQTLSSLKNISTNLTFDFAVVKTYDCQECGEHITVTPAVIKEYHCPLCGSHIQVLRAVILGKEKIIDRCRTCEENKLADETIELMERKKKQKLLEIFESESLINHDLKNKGFKDYVPSHPSQEIALNQAKAFVKDFSLE